MNRNISRKEIKSNSDLTPFQKKVLIQVLEIPRGEGRTYSWVAHRIGSKAYRAVGQVLKKNPYAPEVPCHRVVSSDGSLGGYFGGAVKKRKLLRLEGVFLKR